MQTSEERLLALELRGHVWMFRCPAGQEGALRQPWLIWHSRRPRSPRRIRRETHLRPESRETPITPDRTTCTNRPQTRLGPMDGSKRR